MALVPIRIDRTSKPPIGTPLRSDGHWSVQGLVGAFAFNEGAGTKYANGCTNVISSSTNITNNPSGITDNGTGYVDCGVMLSGMSKFTVIAQIKCTNESAQRQIVSSGYNGTYTEWQMYIEQSTGKLCFGTYNGYEVCAKSAGCVAGRVITAAGSYAGGVWSAFVDGALSGQTSGIGPVTTNRRLMLGAVDIDNTPGQFFYGDIGYVLVFNRALSPQEIASLSANPWQIYEPETVWIEVGGGAEAALFAGTIYGQSSVSAQLSTAIRMAAGAQGHGASTADLSTTIALAADILAASSASGTLSTAIRFGGALSGASTTTAALTNAIALAAQAAGLGSISGQLAGTVAAALFAGTIQGSSSASANLSTAVVLAAAAQGNATAQAALSTALELAAQVNGLGSAGGALGADISGLAGSLHGSSEAQATLSTAIHLMGLAAGQCAVTGRLAEPVEILAQLRVMASDPLALAISVRDPLTLNIAVST